MPRVPQSHNSTTPVQKFDETAYDAVELVAENIDAVIAAAGGVDVITLYLGAYPTEPTENHDGEPLVSGNFYLDTTTSSLKYWDAEHSVWIESDVDTVVTASQDAIAARDAALGAQEAAEAASTIAINEATSAASSASAASTSANEAATSEINANSAEANAISAAGQAATSETNASNSESAAANSASAAATSETNAASSESNASASELNAATSATIASNAAAQAEAAFDNFDDRYLGSFTVPPTVDNDGNPLQVGATYWHDNGDGTGEQRFWSGSSWDVPSVTAEQAAIDAVAARDDAQVSETNAATSAANAANSASAAAASETAASMSEGNAATSETNASNSADAASTSEANAATSETNAAAAEARISNVADLVAWQMHARGEAELNQMRAQNQDARAASGFDQYGLHTSAGPTVNEGISTYYSGWNEPNTNRFWMGRSKDASYTVGTSKTPFAVTHIAGFISEIYGIGDGFNAGSRLCEIKFPEAPNGTVIYDTSGDTRGTGLRTLDLTVDVDPKYGDVASTTNEAVARAFEGFVLNGDFRFGADGSWGASHTSINISTAGIVYTSTGSGRTAYTNTPLTPNTTYELEVGIEAGSSGTLVAKWHDGSNYHDIAALKDGRNKVTFTTGSSVHPSRSIYLYTTSTYSGTVKSVSCRVATEEVVIDRHDLFGGEFFLEEVSQANPFVYPKGMIQSKETTMSGIPTALSNRILTYYAVFDGDTPYLLSPKFTKGGNTGYIHVPPVQLMGDFELSFKVQYDSIGAEEYMGQVNSTVGLDRCHFGLDTLGRATYGTKDEFASDNNFYLNAGQFYEVKLVRVGDLFTWYIDGAESLSYTKVGWNPRLDQFNLGAAGGSGSEMNGQVSQYKLVDHANPENNNFFQVIHYNENPDLTLRTKYSDNTPETETFLDWAAGSNVSLSSTTMTTSNASGFLATFATPTLLPSTKTVTVSFDLESFSGSDAQMFLYRVGEYDGDMKNARTNTNAFGTADVGTRVVFTGNPTDDYSQDTRGVAFSAPSGVTFTAKNIKVVIGENASLENYTEDPWEILSGKAGGGSQGRGVDFWAATDQEKIDLVSDHSNNLFLLSDGRLCQWRMRLRTCAGARNGNWSRDGQSMDPRNPSRYGLTAGRDSSVPQGYLDTMPDYGIAYWTPTNGITNWQVDNPNNAVFKASAGYGGAPYGGMYGECYFHVWGVVRRLNQGAFHPALNPLGTRKWRDARDGSNPGSVLSHSVNWHDFLNPVCVPTATAEAFNVQTTGVSAQVAASSTSGYIGGSAGSGRLYDTRLYDAIYDGGVGGVNDHRLPSWDMSSKEEATKVFQQVVDGTYRGEENLVHTAFYGANDGDGTKSTTIWFDYLDFPEGKTCHDVPVGSPVGGIRADGTGYFVGYVVKVNNNTSLTLDRNATRTSNVYMIPFEMDSSVSGEFHMVDVFGSPSEILLRPDLASGWQGGWIPVIPTTSIKAKEIPLTRKAVSTVMRMTWEDGAGTGWNTGPYNVNQTLNSRDSESFQSNNRVGVYEYTAFAKQTKPANNSRVFNGHEGVGYVYATETAGTGNPQFVESLLGKVLTSNGTNGVAMQELPMTALTIAGPNFTGVEENWGLLAWVDGYSKHEAMTLAEPINGSPAVKALWYQTSKDQQLSLNFAWNELVWREFVDGGQIGANGSKEFVAGSRYRITSEHALENHWACTADITAPFRDFSIYYGDIKVRGSVSGNTFGYLIKPNEMGGWGDDGKLRIAGGTDTYVNLNGDTCLSGTSTLSKPIGYTKNQARVGEQDEGVDL